MNVKVNSIYQYYMYDKLFTYKIESEDENLATLAYQTVFGD